MPPQHKSLMVDFYWNNHQNTAQRSFFKSGRAISIRALQRLPIFQGLVLSNQVILMILMIKQFDWHYQNM